MAVDLTKLPAVMPPQVARVTADGKPTKWLIDWEAFQRNFFSTTVVDLETRIDTVESTAGDAAASVVTEASARSSADGALASQITTVTATANSATASGQIYFAAKAAPTGSAVAYGLYLTAGSAFTGMELLADSGGTSSIAFSSTSFSLTDSGTATNVFSYSGGLFTFNVPVRVGTTDIAANAVTAPSTATSNSVTSKGNTGGYVDVLTLTATGVSGGVAIISLDFVYRAVIVAGTLSGTWRLTRNGSSIKSGPLAVFIEWTPVFGATLDTSVSSSNTYVFQVDVNSSAGSTFEFDSKNIVFDLRKR